MATARDKLKQFSMRIPESIKELIERAADIEGRTQTDFVIEAVRTRALQAVKEHERLELSKRDQMHLAEALLRPPKLTARQKRVARWYKQQSGESSEK